MDGGTLALFNPFRSGSSGSSSITSKKTKSKACFRIVARVAGASGITILRFEETRRLFRLPWALTGNSQRVANIVLPKRKIAEFTTTVNLVIG
jgi:hypothetical protein